MPTYVIDTNAIFGDFHLKSTLLRVVVDAKRVGDEVAIPEVIVDEHVNHFRERITQHAQKVFNAWNSLTELQATSAAAPSLDVDEMVRAYRGKLDARLKDLGIRRLPYPEVDHPTLVARDLKRLKPFNTEGKGYRDALAWESIVALVKEGAEVVFVTNNTTDFGATLDPDLVADLQKRGLRGDGVSIVEKLGLVIEKHLKDRLAAADEFSAQLAQGQHPQLNLYTWLTENAKSLLAQRTIDPRVVGFSSSHHEIIPLEIMNVDAPTVRDVRRLPTGSFLAEAEARVTATFEGVFLDKEEILELPDPPLRRHVTEWTENSMFIETTWAEVLLRFSFVATPEGVVNSRERLALEPTKNREFVDGLDAPL